MKKKEWERAEAKVLCAKTEGPKTKEVYTKPEIKKYPVIQQTTGYIIYYYIT